MTYNGWENYETWVVNLWLTNDECTNNEITRMAQDAYNNKKHTALYQLADQIKAMVEDGMPDLGASMYADLLLAAFDSVDWDDLAKYYLEDVDKGEEEGAL